MGISNRSIRLWYLREMENLKVLLLEAEEASVPISEIARVAWTVQRGARAVGREMMSDREEVGLLKARDEKLYGSSAGPLFDQRVAHYRALGFNGDSAFEQLVRDFDRHVALPAFDQYSVFISYSRADQKFARKLHASLKTAGVEAWLDEHQVLPGDDLYEEIARGVDQWDKLLLCCSRNSLTSWWVDNEIDLAFVKERKLMRARGEKVLALIPIDLDGFLFSSWESGKSHQVKSRLAANFVGWEADEAIFQGSLVKLMAALQVSRHRMNPKPKI